MSELKIMILEDEISLAYTLSAALEKNLGVQVKICTSAEVALQIMQVHEFNLIISDYKLPGMSGLEFIAQARRTLPDVPIIFMTAYGSDTTQEQAQKISDYYINKPFDISELTGIVNDLLGGNPDHPYQHHRKEEIHPASKQILILEDDTSLLRLYRKVFEKSGFMVYTAQTLSEANDFLAHQKFDIFICDVRIDKSYGVDLILIWKEKLTLNNTKVIIASGDPWFRQMSEKIGADYFFRKPVEMSTLINLANNLVLSHGKE